MRDACVIHSHFWSWFALNPHKTNCGWLLCWSDDVQRDKSFRKTDRGGKKRRRIQCFSSIIFLPLEVCSRLSMGLSLQICFLSPENSSTAPRLYPRQLMEMAPRCGTEMGAGSARKSTSPAKAFNMAGMKAIKSDRRKSSLGCVWRSPHNKVVKVSPQ